MLFDNTRAIEISDALFDGNQQTNLQVTLGQIAVTNTTLKNGQGNHIYATQSHVRLDGVVVRDSSDMTVEGHGLTCDNCNSLTITGSTFTNLTSLKAPAILVEN